jgi:stearoyl-CoA desaturase (delta-9 desaturase)
MLENVPVEPCVEERSTGAAGVAPLSPRHLAFVVPLILVHLGCALVFLTGVSKPAVAVFCVSSALQIFGITAGYHRLLAHRSFKTSRAFQFVLATLGVLAGQNGPLWWVGHHRHHHRHSDRDDDTHSPQHGFWWSHMGWLFSPGCVPVRYNLVADLGRCVELVWLERYFYAVNIAYALILYGLGEAWHTLDPTALASGFQFVVCGFVISTVFAYHSIWSANSVCHCFGFRRYATADRSRNNFIVSLVTFGDGWHHNHHFCPNSARHGFRWWEIDINFAILSLLSWLGIVWDLRVPPEAARAIPVGVAGPGPSVVLARKRRR